MKIETDDYIVHQLESNNHVWIKDKKNNCVSHIQCSSKMTEQELQEYADEHQKLTKIIWSQIA